MDGHTKAKLQIGVANISEYGNNMTKRTKRKVLNYTNTKSLLRVRGLAEMDDVPYWEKEILNCVHKVEEWRKETIELDFILPITNISRSIKIPDYDNPKQRTAFHQPNLVWRHSFINGKGDVVQTHYSNWIDIASLLDSRNASIDERQIHYRVHLAILDMNMHARLLVEGLKQAVCLRNSRDMLLAEETIKIGSLPDEILYIQNEAK